MEKLKEILLSNKAKAFYWQTVNGAIILIAIALSDMDVEKYPWVLFAIPMLNAITKTLNKKHEKLKAESKEPIAGLG